MLDIKTIYELTQNLTTLDTDSLAAVHLDDEDNILLSQKVAEGYMDISLISPSEALLNTSKSKAKKIILVHAKTNETEPLIFSHMDKSLMKRLEIGLYRAAKIELLDYLTINSNEFISARKEKELPILL